MDFLNLSTEPKSTLSGSEFHTFMTRSLQMWLQYRISLTYCTIYICDCKYGWYLVKMRVQINNSKYKFIAPH